MKEQLKQKRCQKDKSMKCVVPGLKEKIYNIEAQGGQTMDQVIKIRNEISQGFKKMNLKVSNELNGISEHLLIA